MSNDPDLNWTEGVQVAITNAKGTPVTDDEQVRVILALELRMPYTLPIEHLGDGVWLITLPTSIYQRAELNGGELLTTTTGHRIEIPIP